MLESEYGGHRDASKHLIEQYLKWFAFFSGLNLVGYGWFASELLDDGCEKGTKWLILIVAIYFLIQHILAVVASCQVRKRLKSMEERMLQLLAILESKGVESGSTAQIDVPFGLYRGVVNLVTFTFPTMVLLWIAFAWYAFVFACP